MAIFQARIEAGVRIEKSLLIILWPSVRWRCGIILRQLAHEPAFAMLAYIKMEVSRAVGPSEAIAMRHCELGGS